MEDNQYPVVRKSSKGFWWIIVAIALVIATGVIVFCNHEPIAKIVESQGTTVCEDTAKAVEPVLTIQEVLKFREDIREGIRIDSIFLAMPEPILIDILMTHGTSLSNGDIVYIYESNKEHYKSIKTGADIQRDYITPYSQNDSVKNPRDSLKRQRPYFCEHNCSHTLRMVKTLLTTNQFVRIGQSSENDKPVGRK